jgi:hypothetical protein
MLFSMLRSRTSLRIAIALLVVVTMGFAGPIHAAHHHSNDALHATCAVCQLHSPAAQPLLQVFAGVPLELVSTLAVNAVPAPHSARVAVVGTRAPPSHFA